MSAPFRPFRKPGHTFKPGKLISVRHQHYEVLKAQLTARATTPAEYESAVRQAAKMAGI